MKITKIFVAATCCAAMTFAFACAPKTAVIDFNNVPDTERCQYMKDVCKEAQAFQGQYEGMSAEEKREAKAVLNAYVQQCEGAQEMCKKSQ